MKSLFLLLLIILVLPSQVIAQTSNLDTNLLQSLGDVKYHELKSAQLKRSFHIFVDLPEDYRDSGQDYPTIYLLDGGNTFPLMAAHHHSTDYTAPSEEREFWGGAAVFQALLEDELLPMIEATYRSDPARRIIFGQSLGGQFVLLNALSKPGLFFGHIASNPAMHRNLPFFLKWHGEKEFTQTLSRVFVSSGEYDDPIFRGPTLEWFKYWQAVTPRPWALETRTLAGQTHLSATPEAFRQGLEWMFSEPME